MLADYPAPLRQEMPLSAERAESETTKKLYAEYRNIRTLIIEELRHTHGDVPTVTLVAHARTILDRVLFLAFAEGRKLLPPGTLAHVNTERNTHGAQSNWQNLLTLFRSVAKRNSDLQIPNCEGGLFREIPEFATLAVSDQTCAALLKLTEYDFVDDVSVNVLGHIFEQSLSDLEGLLQSSNRASGKPRVRRSTTGRSRSSKRNVEGIFYTPSFITRFLVRETLGRTLCEAWERIGGSRAATQQEQIASWRAYQHDLSNIRLLDPACGSGAFLVAAYDTLAQESERSNRALSCLQRHDRNPDCHTTANINEGLFGIDTSGESVELTRLSLWLKAAEHGGGHGPSSHNILQGNSVVSDSALDPWAFDWESGYSTRLSREACAVSETEASSMGAHFRRHFDIVLGNPPYLRHELLGAYKEHWRSNFITFDGNADIFVYFFEQGLRRLSPGGRLGFIVSNKWLRGGYAYKLRSHLAAQCTIETIVDFGHAPIFPDADAFPCIITMRKSVPPPDHHVNVTLYPHGKLGKELLASHIDSQHFPLAQSNLSREGWALEPAAVQTLIGKLRQNGVPLGQYVHVKPYRGVVTGCNEAFLVDSKTKERLCRQDPRSAEVLKKVLRGQDVRRWSPKWAGLWMIFTRRGIDISRYPRVQAHLEVHRKTLEPRPKDFSGNDWPGRKAGTYQWYEIQDAVAYHQLFEQPKIIYQEIQYHSAYAIESCGLLLNNKAYLLESADPWLVAVLNSPALWWHNWRYLVHLKDEALSPAGHKMLQVPIAQPSAAQRDLAAALVAEVVELSRDVHAAHTAFSDRLRLEYGVESARPTLSDMPSAHIDHITRSVSKRLVKASSQLSPIGLSELRELVTAETLDNQDKRRRITDCERAIASVVHAAFGLDQADLALLRDTMPPRMPPGW